MSVRAALLQPFCGARTCELLGIKKMEQPFEGFCSSCRTSLQQGKVHEGVLPQLKEISPVESYQCSLMGLHMVSTIHLQLEPMVTAPTVTYQQANLLFRDLRSYNLPCFYTILIITSPKPPVVASPLLGVLSVPRSSLHSAGG